MTSHTGGWVLAATALLCLGALPEPAEAGEMVVKQDAEEPAWLAGARESASAGVEAYYAADFEQASAHLVKALKALTAGFGEHPVGSMLMEEAAVTLILSLHALGRDAEALDVATGLAAFAPPPWAGHMDLAPDARAYLDGIGSGLGPPVTGNVTVTADATCDVTVDGVVVGRDDLQALELTTGPHWLQAICESGAGAHVRVDVEAGATAEVTLEDPAGDKAAPVEEEEAPGIPANGSSSLLLDATTDPAPWYGDGWNIAFQAGGVLLLGVGAGLLGGALELEGRAHTTRSLAYAGMEKRSLQMEVAGWVLLGSGAVLLAVGVVRLARSGGVP